MQLKVAALVLASFALALSFGAVHTRTALAQCPPYIVQDMILRGVPAWEIQRMCGAVSPPSPVQMGAYCASQAGICPMGMAGPVGAPCWCNTMFGPAQGRVVN